MEGGGDFYTVMKIYSSEGKLFLTKCSVIVILSLALQHKFYICNKSTSRPVSIQYGKELVQKLGEMYAPLKFLYVFPLFLTVDEMIKTFVFYSHSVL
jgi:hypothetical protein